MGITNSSDSIVLHIFSDLSRVRTLFFVCFLKRYFRYVNHIKPIKRNADYHEIGKPIIEALRRDVSPTYIISCLNDLLYIVAPSGKQPTNLFMAVLCGLVDMNPTFAHHSEARILAGDLFSSLLLSGSVPVNDLVLVHLAKIFEFKIEELREELQALKLDYQKLEELKTFILKLIRCRHFCTAAAVIKRLGCGCDEFLDPIMDADEHQIAEVWATSEYTENDMTSSLVRRYRSRSLFKLALNMVYKYNLFSEFPDMLYEYKESEMTKLVIKGNWGQAKFIVQGKNKNVEARLFQRLQNLALEITGEELEQLLVKEDTSCLKLQDISFSENDVIMIDTERGLAQALMHFTDDEVDVIGVDSEWINGARRNVCILQIATPKKVFIFDLINLFNREPDALDMRLKAVFHSDDILKLGYDLQADLKQLSNSYEELECFHNRKTPTLDLKHFFHPLKGLTGLAKTVLGKNLNKNMQLSDWRQRPLSNGQLHYAALDADVLIAIYRKECQNPSLASSAGSTEKQMEALEEPSSSVSV